MAADVSFEDWLTSWLRSLKTDEAVFGPYITSILEGDEEQEDKVEALDGILMELGDGTNVHNLRNEILSRWEKSVAAAKASMALNRAVKSSILSGDPSQRNGMGTTAESTLGDQLDEILRFASESAEKSGNGKSMEPAADPKLRAAILSTMDESSDSDGEVAESGLAAVSSSSASVGKKKPGTIDSALLTDFGRNVNAEKVLNEQKEGRDKAKAEAAKKRERDKEDRAKQKAASADRKEKAKKKATKVERKR